MSDKVLLPPAVWDELDRWDPEERSAFLKYLDLNALSLRIQSLDDFTEVVQHWRQWRSDNI